MTPNIRPTSRRDTRMTAPMVIHPNFPRRLMLRRLAGGGAVVCTFLAAHGSFSPHAAAAGGTATRRTTPLVLLDPGHGGRDPGATGARGTLEKDVTLASGLAV